MENPEIHQISPAAMKLVLTALESMRDALVQLSLVLSDYCFDIEFDNRGGTALEVEEALAKIMATTKRTH